MKIYIIQICTTFWIKLNITLWYYLPAFLACNMYAGARNRQLILMNLLLTWKRPSCNEPASLLSICAAVWKCIYSKYVQPSESSRILCFTYWAAWAKYLSDILECRLCSTDIFVYKVNVANVTCTRANAFISDSRTDILEQVSNLNRIHLNLSIRGRLQYQTFGFMPNTAPIELPRSDISYPMFWNTGFGGG